MAKKMNKVSPSITPEQLRAGIIAEIKPGFTAFLAVHKAMIDKAEFAPQFVTAFLDWVDSFDEKTKKAATRIAYLRELDPTIPEHKEDSTEKGPGYHTNPAYMAATYLFRIGYAELKSIAKEAVDMKQATPRQKALAAKKHTTSKPGENGKLAGVEVPINDFLTAVALCEVSADNFGASLKEAGVKDEVVKAIIEAYAAIVKRVAEEV